MILSMRQGARGAPRRFSPFSQTPNESGAQENGILFVTHATPYPDDITTDVAIRIFSD
jgi:hypothetical protein